MKHPFANTFRSILSCMLLFTSPCLGISPLVSCGRNQNKEQDETKPATRKDYRVLLTSDIHLTDLGMYYQTPSGIRVQHWVDAILKEHEKEPFDLIVIAGDVSLDHWGWNGGGSYQRDPSKCDTEEFVKNYVSQLPEDVPVIVLPGNHELYNNSKWKELTGNNRDASFVLGTNLFIMPDSYSGISDPPYLGGGKNDNPYTPVDMKFIRHEIDKHPECTSVYLISHHFDMEKESAAFKELLKNETRIVGLYSGHTHVSSVIRLGEEYRSLTIAQTGSFVSAGAQDIAHFGWGFRDLLIKADGTAASRYIIPVSDFYVNAQKYTSEYKITDTVTYPSR